MSCKRFTLHMVTKNASMLENKCVIHLNPVKRRGSLVDHAPQSILVCATSYLGNRSIAKPKPRGGGFTRNPIAWGFWKTPPF